MTASPVSRLPLSHASLLTRASPVSRSRSSRSESSSDLAPDAPRPVERGDASAARDDSDGDPDEALGNPEDEATGETVDETADGTADDTADEREPVDAPLPSRSSGARRGPLVIEPGADGRGVGPPRTGDAMQRRPAWDVDPFLRRPRWLRGLGSPTGEGVRIGVVDSGWDRTIDDDKVRPGISFVDPDDELACKKNDDDHDTNGHGTGCIDVIRRIAPAAEIVPIRVFGREIETSPGTLQSAIHWASEQGLQLINVSLGTLREDVLKPLYVTCEKARRGGSILVAAAHNHSTWSYPAVFENVLSVGRLTAVPPSPYDYAYRPGEATECLAMGTHHVQWIGGQTAFRAGTSFAAPVMTGIVALLLERHPDADLDAMREILAQYAADEKDE